MNDRAGESDRRIETRRVLNLLARGIHPVDGTILSDEGCWNDPVVIRALLFAADHLEVLNSENVVSKRKDTTSDPDRVGKSWLPEEDDELRIAFGEEKTLQVIAAAHKRSEGGILARIVRLGVVKDRDEAREIFVQRKKAVK